jgi:hypothetical protein
MTKKQMAIEARIDDEYKRLIGLFGNMLPERLSLYDGLIKRAAFMRVTLEIYEADINRRGSVEKFTQSAATKPYERERPAARLYGSMNTNYQKIMKQLLEALPEAVQKDAEEEINEWLKNG